MLLFLKFVPIKLNDVEATLTTHHKVREGNSEVQAGTTRRCTPSEVPNSAILTDEPTVTVVHRKKLFVVLTGSFTDRVDQLELLTIDELPYKPGGQCHPCVGDHLGVEVISKPLWPVVRYAVTLSRHPPQPVGVGLLSAPLGFGGDQNLSSRVVVELLAQPVDLLRVEEVINGDQATPS